MDFLVTSHEDFHLDFPVDHPLDHATEKEMTFKSTPLLLSVGFVGGQQSGVDWLHAGGTSEGAHEPVVNALSVVRVHAGKVAQPVPYHKLPHTNHTSETEKKTVRNILYLIYTQTKDNQT